MIDVTNRRLYSASLECLRRFKTGAGAGYKGRFVQLFLGLKFYQNEIPSMFSNSFVSTEVLQTMLDDLYAKANRPSNDCVLVLFEDRYLARTGLIGLNNTTPQNTWRNNFNLQKGIGCYAPPHDLASQTFLDQDRIDCRHLSPAGVGGLAGSTCSLCPTSARYRNESHRKWLRIDPSGAGYAAVDVFNVSNFAAYVTPGGNRLPALPTAVALYHEADPSLRLGGRKEIDLDDLMNDFNFGTNEFHSYFDDSPTHPLNADLLRRFRSLGYRRVALSTVARRGGRPSAATRLRSSIVRAPVLTGTPAPPPNVNTGWDAERFVFSLLQQNGWTVYDVSRQQLGYDLLAQRGRRTIYVEVKSSAGFCTPAFTSREWQQAERYGTSYILGVLEKFDPLSMNTVYWISDPAHACLQRESLNVTHSIPRNAWITATVPITSI
ncbi:MAG TPA: hypothetical protein DC047_15600 [Blastocatellia bacterium]|nr:hypothetical protein [Blastocatellia bacterium]